MYDWLYELGFVGLAAGIVLTILGLLGIFYGGEDYDDFAVEE